MLRQLDRYMKSVMSGLPSDPNKYVVLGNMAKSNLAGGSSNELEDRIVVSIVNLEEESSLKNRTSHKKIGGHTIALPPPIHLNLYLLFAANVTNYSQAIDSIFRVVEFFQGYKVFKFKNMILEPKDLDSINSQIELEICMDLHTLSFEQLNDLWGSLGGKQVPFVLYRARLVPIQMELPQAQFGLITEIDVSLEENLR